MSFSATDAAFEGFRLVRRNPLAILFWALVYIVFFAALFALVGGQMASIMAQAEALQGGEPDLAEIQALGMSYLTILGLGLPLGLMLTAVLSTGVARGVLRPSEKAFGYLRLGGDELRVLAVTVILGLCLFLAYIVAAIVVGVLAGLVGDSNPGVLVLVVMVAGLAGFALVVWLAVRLSLAVPITLAEKRIAPFASFALTKGKTLPLLGMAIIAFIMSVVVSLLGTIIALPVTMLTGGGLAQLATMDGLSTSQIVQAAAPGLVAWGVVNAILSALQLAVLYAPFSAAYRDIKGLPHQG